MKTETPQIGSIGYLADGSIVRLLAKNSDDRFVVEVGRKREDDEEGEVFWDGIKTVSNVYAQPPLLAVEKRIAELESKEQALKESIRELQKKQTEESAMMARLKAFDYLKDIDAFLQGKITHYVTWDNNYNKVCCDFRVTTPLEEKCGDESRSSDLKMLGLYGRQDSYKKGVLPNAEWRLTYYRDGTGSSYRYAKPCLSLDEAMQFAATMLDDSLAKYAQDTQAGEWHLKKLVSSCQNCFYDVPAWLTERVKKLERDSLQADVRKRVKELHDAQAKLDALLNTTSVS